MMTDEEGDDFLTNLSSDDDDLEEAHLNEHIVKNANYLGKHFSCS